MSAPPPYYATAQAADNCDVATEIKNLSCQTIQVDKKFQAVQTIIERDGLTGPELRREWRGHRKVFTDLLWSARTAATQVGSYNRDFVDVIIPTLADASETTADKLAELDVFIKKAPPKLLTETEATQKIQQLKVAIKEFAEKHYADGEAQIAEENQCIEQFQADSKKQKEEQEKAKSGSIGRILGFTRPPHVELVNYDFRIEQARARIVALSEQQNEVKQAVNDVAGTLDSVATRVGGCFATVWTQINTDAGHIKARMEGSNADPTPDISAAGRMYTQIMGALTYYATNIDKT